LLLPCTLQPLCHLYTRFPLTNACGPVACVALATLAGVAANCVGAVGKLAAAGSAFVTLIHVCALITKGGGDDCSCMGSLMLRVSQIP
jgi:hypothetical protein